MKLEMPPIEDIILTAFDQLGYVENENFIDSGRYYTCHSPITEDHGSMSAMVYKDEGNIKIFNASVTVVRDGVEVDDSSLSLTEWLRYANLFYVYMQTIFEYNFIKKTEINEYKEWLYDIILDMHHPLPYKKKKRFEELRKSFFKMYIVDSDFFKEESKEITYKKVEKKEKKEDKKININYDLLAQIRANKYLKARGLEPRDDLKGVTVEFASGQKASGLSIEYKNGFRKIRMLNNGIMRYLANKENGKYEILFEAKISNNDIAILCEGELDAISLSTVVDDYDIFGLHNVNSIPNSNKIKEQLQKYNKIIIVLDRKDCDKNKKGLMDKLTKLFFGKIEILPKTPTEDDFNDYLIRGELTKENIVFLHKK